MNEYVVLAHQFSNPEDWDSSIAEWKVGTIEQAKYWLEKWESEGYIVHVRQCTHPLNSEFVKAELTYKGKRA
jgi:hypothetical protein